MKFNVASSPGLSMKGQAEAYKAVGAANVSCVLHLQTLGACVSSVEHLHYNICAYPCAYPMSSATITS